MALPPGPRWPAAIQTVLLLLRGQLWMEKVSQRYGDLFTLRTLIFGTQVFTSDPALIQQLFTGDPDVYEAGKANSSALMFTGRSSVLVLDGDPHRRMRRLLMPPFHGERMHAYAEEMRRIAERVAASWPREGPFSLLPSMQKITLEVILASVFGLPEGPRRDLFADRLKAMMDRMASPKGAFFLIPALQRDLGPLWPWRRLKAQFDELEALIFDEIATRRASLEVPGAPPRADILSLLLATRDEDGQGMSDREIRDQIWTLLVAGHETTASSLSWAFERVLSHPAVHERLLGEIGAAEGAGKGAAIDLGEMPYLDATIKEVLRQRPSVPMLGRKLSRPVKLRDHEIPAGVMVSASVYLTHRRPEIYADPEAFKPERFLGKKIDPYSYFPFGGGPRRCLGAAFATLEMKVVLASVLRRYRMRLVDRAPLQIAPRSIFLAPEGGTRVVFEAS